MNCDFSFGVLAGNASRNLIEDTKMLSKNCDCWNSRAFMRCAGLRVINRGRTADFRSLGNGLEDRKLLLIDGVVDDEVKSFLYVERLELVLSGEVWGEL